MGDGSGVLLIVRVGVTVGEGPAVTVSVADWKGDKVGVEDIVIVTVRVAVSVALFTGESVEVVLGVAVIVELDDNVTVAVTVAV